MVTNILTFCYKMLESSTLKKIKKGTGGYSRYSSSWEPNIRAMRLQLPYGITQCYLPPDTSERAPHNPNHLTPTMQAGTQFTYPEGMEG